MSNPTPVVNMADTLAQFLARVNQFNEPNQDLIQQKRNKVPGDGTTNPGFPATESTSRSVAQWPNMLDDFVLEFFKDEIGIKALGGVGFVSGQSWAFDVDITDSDPGAGKWKFNNATQSAATFIYINKLAANGADAGAALFAAMVSGSLVYTQQAGDDTRFHWVTQSGALVDAGAYVKIPITSSDAGADIQDTQNCGVWVYLSPGAATGDVVGPGSSVDNRVALFDGVTGKLLKEATNVAATATGLGVGIDTPDAELHVEGSKASAVIARVKNIEGGVNSAAQVRLTTDSVNRRIVGKNLADANKSAVVLGDGQVDILGDPGGTTVLASFGSAGVSLTPDIINGVTITAHASRHDPGSTDPIATAAAAAVGVSNSEGAAASVARSDHGHQVTGVVESGAQALSIGSVADGQVLTRVGTDIIGTNGASGGGTSSEWKFSTNTTQADPGSGNFRLNNADPSLATAMYISDDTDTGIDASSFLSKLIIGDVVRYQKKDTSVNDSLYEISADPINNTTWWEIPLNQKSTSGVLPGNNKVCLVSFILLSDHKKNNLTAVTDPVVGDDNLDGYSVGSIWLNTVSDEFFAAADVSTGAAVWSNLSSGGGSADLSTPTAGVHGGGEGFSSSPVQQEFSLQYPGNNTTHFTTTTPGSEPFEILVKGRYKVTVTIGLYWTSAIDVIYIYGSKNNVSQKFEGQYHEGIVENPGQLSLQWIDEYEIGDDVGALIEANGSGAGYTTGATCTMIISLIEET